MTVTLSMRLSRTFSMSISKKSVNLPERMTIGILASTVMANQAQLDRDKKVKEKEQLEAFVRRFSANASKAKQATSRQKQLDKLTIEDIKPSSRRDPSIVFKAKRQMGDEALTCSQCFP